jgi:citrate synthase
VAARVENHDREGRGAGLATLTKRAVDDRLCLLEPHERTSASTISSIAAASASPQPAAAALA